MSQSLKDIQWKLHNQVISFCNNKNFIYQDIQVFIEENFDIKVCNFHNNGVKNNLGEADWICKHLLLCVFLKIPKDKSLALLKEYSEETNKDLHGNHEPRYPNIAALFLGNMESITFNQPINKLIKIKEK